MEYRVTSILQIKGRFELHEMSFNAGEIQNPGDVLDLYAKADDMVLENLKRQAHGAYMRADLVTVWKQNIFNEWVPIER